jgi:hypothetical protein
MVIDKKIVDFYGAPERIRTSDPQIRSLVLYPAELRAPVRLRLSTLGGAAALRTSDRLATSETNGKAVIFGTAPLARPPPDFN